MTYFEPLSRISLVKGTNNFVDLQCTVKCVSIYIFLDVYQQLKFNFAQSIYILILVEDFMTQSRFDTE